MSSGRSPAAADLAHALKEQIREGEALRVLHERDLLRAALADLVGADGREALTSLRATETRAVAVAAIDALIATLPATDPGNATRD